MIPTFIGVGVAAIAALILLRGSVLGMFAMLVGCSLMPGSAAILLPALGGSSIPPVQFALAFMVLILLVGENRLHLLWRSMACNLPLVCFAAYGIVMAMLGPRIFRGDMWVYPMFMKVSGIGAHTSPLTFTTQNITASIYMIGLLMLSVCACTAMMHRDGFRRLVSIAVFMAWTQSFLGVSGSLLANTPWGDFLDLFRNGSYAQLDQNFGSFVRMKGLAPESSSFAMSGFAWFVFLFECWIRGVSPRRTGPAAAVIGLVLLFSTSSTAYLGLGGYGAIFMIRTLLVPGSTPLSKLLVMGAGLLVAIVAAVAVAALVPQFAALFGEMLQTMTVGKSSSGSAIERSTWARQGIDAFVISGGLGVGPGSFRSSSIITSMLGATGVVGSVAFLTHLVRVMKPLRASTYVRVLDAEASVGASASWAAFAIMIPASMVLPGVDPGPEFAILGGAALALRWNSIVTFAFGSVQPMRHGHETMGIPAAG